ncbi:hypothetical protein [Streptomyces johnsoniae]|uniref:Lipoprotein n=1 Tax=Streptomyces johnsoniae TaxID=3075532 RepID=A0ABU2RZ05_9ACTN|nr:hypothetical protein [Streptomyces sp. DSM 41886]MDT0441999.1 hypothetical protein [Streptomyces sp. DSM 41886]
MRPIASAAALSAALLLAGCGDDDEAGGPGLGGFASGGNGEENGSGGLPDLELDDELQLETTGGFGGDDGGSGSPVEGGEDWYAHWESAGITLYTTTDGVLYGNPGTGDVCTQEAGIAGGLDWEPVLFTCQGSSLKNANLRLSGDTLAIEWDDRTEEVSRVESLTGRTVDLDALEATILN